MASEAKTIRRVLSGEWAKPGSRLLALQALDNLEEQLEAARAENERLRTAYGHNFSAARELSSLRERLETCHQARREEHLERCREVDRLEEQLNTERSQRMEGDRRHIEELIEVERERDGLLEQLETARETFRLVAMACGEDGTEPEDWRAMTHPSHAEFALTAARDLRDAYDELLMDPRLADTYPASRSGDA